MPSPIAHAGTGWLLYAVFYTREAHPRDDQGTVVRPALLATIALSMLPDLDALVGAVAGDLGRFHNAFASSLFVGLVAALAAGAAARFVWRCEFRRWFIIGALCYELHVLMDFATVGGGVMLWWPFSSERFVAPIKLFYGLHWSHGWLSTSHIVTVLTEVVFVGLLAIAIYAVKRRRRTISMDNS